MKRGSKVTKGEDEYIYWEEYRGFCLLQKFYQVCSGIQVCFITSNRIDHQTFINLSAFSRCSHVTLNRHLANAQSSIIRLYIGE